MKTHLTKQLATEIIAHRVETGVETDAFFHWRDCPGCRAMLSSGMDQAGFSFDSGKKIETVSVGESHGTMDIQIVAAEHRVVAVCLSEDEWMETEEKLMCLGVKIRQASSSDFSGQIAEKVLCSYTEGKLYPAPKIHPLLIHSTFSLQVLFWTWMIPFGKTATYGEVAFWVNQPQAARGVGSSLHHNPIPLIIPCHRIIGAGGKLVGFGGGLAMKRKLLELERSI